MSITNISFDWGVDPTMVRITTTDSLATITTTGYWTTQADTIDSLNHGAFVFPEGCLIAINYSNGEGFFTFDSTNQTFLAETNPGSLSETLADGRIFVGSAGNIATGVAMSGDVAISNSGVTTIQAGAVDSSMVNSNLLQYATVAISAVEFNGMYAAPKLLVAAAGANTLITLHRAELVMTYVSAQYANGGVVAIQYDSTINGAGVIASTTQAAADFADAASTSNAFEGGIVKQPFTTCVNKGLYLSNVTGAFDTGDSTFVMHLWYSIIPTA